MPDSMRDALKKAGVKVPPRDPPQGRASGRKGGRPGGRRSGPGSRGRPRPGRAGAAPPKLPDSYFQADGHGHPCLRAEFVAKTKLDPYVQAFKNGSPSLTVGQLRRFFNHCREIERQLTIESKSWQRVAAAFASTSAHAHNACAARPKKIPVEFRDFIDANVNRVLGSDDPKTSFLRGFLPHFEAIVGFGAAHLKK